MPIESTPVSGVATMKLAVLAFEAPARLIPMAVGITEQEHSGNGVPIKAAVTTELFSPMIRFIKASGMSCLITPAKNKPNSR